MWSKSDLSHYGGVNLHLPAGEEVDQQAQSSADRIGAEVFAKDERPHTAVHSAPATACTLLELNIQSQSCMMSVGE